MMLDRASFGEWMGIPAYLYEEHLSIQEDAPHKEGEESTPPTDLNAFLRGDSHITAAALWLHPLLSKEVARALGAALGEIADATEALELGEGKDEARVHLVIEGRLRLILTTPSGRKVEIGQCRPGQWLGIPNALRAYDALSPKEQWSETKTVIEAVPLGRLRTQSVSLRQFVALMHREREVLRFARHHVAIRYARREEILKKIRQSPILRMLPPADQEYLLQLGTLKRVNRAESQPALLYMAAKKRSSRIALVLRGECTAFLPGRPPTFVGKFQQHDLVGHEGIVMPEEMEREPEEEIEIVEPPRTTDIYASPGMEALELNWYALRWVLDDRRYVWKRVAQRIFANRTGGTVPEVVCIQASSKGLGTTSIAHTVACMLANASRCKVCVVDAQVSSRYESYWKPRGFTRELKIKPLRPRIRDLRDTTELQGQTISYERFMPPQYDERSAGSFGWAKDVYLISPMHMEATEAIVEAFAARDDLRYVIVCMEQDAERASDTERQLALGLNARADMVLYVTDTPEQGYLFSQDVTPTHTTWVEPMTDRYRENEHKEARKALNEARFGDCLRVAPKGIRDTFIDWVGGLPDDTASVDFMYRRKVVRVPDDPYGARILETEGPLALERMDSRKFPLKRACERLVRVITRRTVGLALGGGGAWGYAHVALLKNMEQSGVPIDFIAGTSFGAIVGGLYVAGGMHALDRLVAENALSATSPASAFLAPFTSPLMRAVLLASVSAASLEWFINSHLRRLGVNGGEPVELGMTEIPFYPIGANLDTHTELSEEHAPLGLGVRMSGTMPPVAPALRKNGQLVVDGGFIANVPSRYLREIGADFIIAANTVPPAPGGAGKSRGLLDLAFARFSDALRANQLLTWKAGQDQAELTADLRMNLSPKDANVFDMWKGKAIVDQILRDHFTGSGRYEIANAWKSFHIDPFITRNAAVDNINDGG